MVSLASGSSLGSQEVPYFNRTAEHFCSHQHTPDSGESAGPGMTRGKDGIYIGWQVFSEYARHGALISKRMVQHALDLLLGGEKTLETTLGAQGVATLMEQEGRGEIFNRLCERYDVDIPVQELVRIYRETEPVLVLYPDGEKFLARLEKEQIKTGLITDGNVQVQHNKIRALGLDQRLDVVLASYDLGLRKPDTGVYTYCLEKLGCRPEEAVYIGDNPLKDFIGAGKLGMKTVRIIRPEGLHMWRTAQEGYEADRTVHLLTEVSLEQW